MPMEWYGAITKAGFDSVVSHHVWERFRTSFEKYTYCMDCETLDKYFSLHEEWSKKVLDAGADVWESLKDIDDIKRWVDDILEVDCLGNDCDPLPVLEHILQLTYTYSLKF